jgi:hypothetical protein
MSKQEQFLLQLDAMLELEARERLETSDDYYVNDVACPQYSTRLHCRLNAAERREYYRQRDAWALGECAKNDVTQAEERRESEELLAHTKRQVFLQAVRLSGLYLPTMIKQSYDSPLAPWARKLLKHYHGHAQLGLVKVYLYLVLKSHLAWEQDQSAIETSSKEDRLKDLAVESTYDGGHEQFALYVTSLSLAVVEHKGSRIVAQDRPDQVVAA